MNLQSIKSENDDLRQKAEAILNNSESKESSYRSETDVLKLIHELEVNQIELELINEELNRTISIAQDAIGKYTEFHEFAPTGYFTLNEQSRITEVNHSGAFLLGKERSRLINDSFDFYVSKDTKPAFNDFLHRVFSNRTIESCEVTLSVHNNNQVHVYLAGMFAVNLEHCIVTVMDITKQKESELELHKSEERFRMTLQNAPITVFQQDTDLRYTWIHNLQVDLKPEDIVGKKDQDFVPAEYAARLKEIKSKVLKEGIGINTELDMVVMGNKYSYTLIINPLLDPSGKIIGITGISWDVTERRKIEDSLHESQSLLQTAMDTSQTGIAIADAPNGKLRYVNDAGLRIQGSDYKTLVEGIDIDQYVSSWNLFDLDGRRLQPDEVPLARAVRYGETNSKEFIIRRKSGDDRIVVANASPIRDTNGKVIAGIVVFMDTTDHRNAETMIIVKNQELQKLIAEKDKLFSIIAHDLRSPFNSFLGATEMLAEDLQTLSPGEIQKLAEGMHLSATNLYELLENLLEWSRMQRNLIPLNLIPIHLRAGIVENMVLAMEAAHKKEITVSNQISEDIWIYADKYLLGGIIRNLSSNVVKFTPKGGSLKISAKHVAGNYIEITFKDTGIGMDKHTLKNLFSFDGYVCRRGTDGESSTGLGLVVCKEFIEKHGGKIWASSTEGKGSTFRFTLPANREII
jgi:PAS domain S-box-containing protein